MITVKARVLYCTHAKYLNAPGSEGVCAKTVEQYVQSHRQNIRSSKQYAINTLSSFLSQLHFIVMITVRA